MAATEFLTFGEIADRCKVSVDCVRDMMRQHGLPAYKFGGSWRVPTAEFEEWWRSRSFENLQALGR